MVHGEDLMQASVAGQYAYAQNGSARMTERMAASGGLTLDGQKAAAMTAGQSVRSVGPSIASVIAAAERADETVGQRVKALYIAAERAESIATRLVGPSSARGPAETDAASGGNALSGRDDSAFSAMQAAVDRIGLRATSGDPALARLHAALQQIERLLG